jgi:predicted double-glycine peptidase
MIMRPESMRYLILAALMMGLSVPVPVLAAGDRSATGTGRGRQPVRSLLEMRRDKVVVQKWDLSCGAAALATLLAYQHGDPVPEREVAKGMIRRKEYLVDPSRVQTGGGFSLLDLQRYVDQRGYAGVGYGQLAFEDLVELAPILVPLRLNGYDHFVVFRGIRGDRVLLADPAWGNRVMSVGKFEDAWLDFPEFGRVGFEVKRRDGAEPPNQLAPTPADFLISPRSVVRAASR